MTNVMTPMEVMMEIYPNEDNERRLQIPEGYAIIDSTKPDGNRGCRESSTDLRTEAA